MAFFGIFHCDVIDDVIMKYFISIAFTSQRPIRLRIHQNNVLYCKNKSIMVQLSRFRGGVSERRQLFFEMAPVRSQISKFLKNFFAMNLLSRRVNDSPKTFRIGEKSVFLKHPTDYNYVILSAIILFV